MCVHTLLTSRDILGSLRDKAESVGKGCSSCLGWLCHLPCDGDSLSGLPGCCLYTQHGKSTSLWVKKKITLEIVPCEIAWYPGVPMNHGYDGLDHHIIWNQIQRLITLWVLQGLILITGHLPAALPPANPYPCECTLSPHPLFVHRSGNRLNFALPGREEILFPSVSQPCRGFSCHCRNNHFWGSKGCLRRDSSLGGLDWPLLDVKDHRATIHLSKQ